MSNEREASVEVFQPNINITLSGLLAIFTMKRPCEVGFLKRAHHPHKLEVKVTEIDKSGITKDITPCTLKDPLELIVTPSQGISFRKLPRIIKRKSPPAAGTEDSFAWAVDLENDELYGKEIGAKKAGFRSFLIFNSGELFTAAISETMLERLDPGERDFKPFGFVAVKIGVHIPLDQPGVKAVLMNGSDSTPVFVSQPDKRYEISIDRGSVNPPTDPVTDAESYYLDKAIGGKLKDSEKIHFQSRLGEYKIGPEAACFITSLGKSGPE